MKKRDKNEHKLEKMLLALSDKQNNIFQDHSKDISRTGMLTAEQMKKDWPELGITDEFIRDLELAVRVHDIGKMNIPKKILIKPNTLSPGEYQAVKAHTWAGITILRKETEKLEDTIKETELYQMCHDVILYHHERLDGSGYPLGLKGAEIPISAQIMAVIDSFDAMTNQRVYRQPVGRAEALEMLKEETDRYSQKVLISFEKMLKMDDIL